MKTSEEGKYFIRSPVFFACYLLPGFSRPYFPSDQGGETFSGSLIFSRFMLLWIAAPPGASFLQKSDLAPVAGSNKQWGLLS